MISISMKHYTINGSEGDSEQLHIVYGPDWWLEEAISAKYTNSISYEILSQDATQSIVVQRPTDWTGSIYIGSKTVTRWKCTGYDILLDGENAYTRTITQSSSSVATIGNISLLPAQSEQLPPRPSRQHHQPSSQHQQRHQLQKKSQQQPLNRRPPYPVSLPLSLPDVQSQQLPLQRLQQHSKYSQQCQTQVLKGHVSRRLPRQQHHVNPL